MLEWLDKRLFIRDLLSRPVIPRGKAHWQYFPGFFTFLLVFFQLASGILLAFYYVPGVAEHKGNFWRYLYNCHYIGAQVLVLSVFLYFLRNLLAGTYQAPRELHWLVIITLCCLIYLTHCTGSLLPADASAEKTLGIFRDVLGQIPWIGDKIIHGLGIHQGFTAVSTHRLYVLHSFVLPTMIYFLIFFYFWLLTKSGIAVEEKTGA